MTEPSTEYQMKNKTEYLVVKIEPGEEGDHWQEESNHNDDGTSTDDTKAEIKQERPSTPDDNDDDDEDAHDDDVPVSCKEDTSTRVIRSECAKTGLGSPSCVTEKAASCRQDIVSVNVKSEYDEDEESDNIEDGRSVKPIPQYTVKVEVADKLEKIPQFTVKVEIADNDDDDIDNDSLVRYRISEKEKHFCNIKALLECTNATLIRSHEDVGYTCFFCDKYYQDPADLKDHATSTHKVIEEKDFTKVYVAGYVAKLDITGLRCKLCRGNIETLEGTIAHLHGTHSRKLFLDIKNQIVPFKFNSSIHRCCICSKEFNKFRSLQAHVQVHYRNYECGQCDLAFINRMKFVQHLHVHRIGVFTCQYCSKQFDTEFKKKKHEKNVHDESLKVKCGLCNERFKYPRQKELHLTRVHSVDPTNRCHLCEKVFVTQDALSVHVKRDHLKRRNARCPECEMTFFSPSQLKIHMVKHTGIPQFECTICHKSYRRKNYYYEHMRIHTNDRRHKCKLCDMAFVHKTSLKHHLRSKHGEEYVPGSY